MHEPLHRRGSVVLNQGLTMLVDPVKMGSQLGRLPDRPYLGTLSQSLNAPKGALAALRPKEVTKL
jgi:hypothetical protein